MMQTPELLLAPLNQALLNLRAAMHVLKDEGRLDTEIIPVMQRLILTQVMSERWVIAVGGSQGAGKTTLISAIYDLDQAEADKIENSWLQPNEGRGENLPVLIQEDKHCEKPQGYVLILEHDSSQKEYVLEEKKVTVNEFQMAARGADAKVMLPILKVPSRYFSHGQAMLLLPGYEPINKENKFRQNLMRHMLISAAGCIIVTDSTRLANAQQQEILKDMLSNELDALSPIIVITKTENLINHPNELAQLRNTALSIFEFKDKSQTPIAICTGVSHPDYKNLWLPQLAEHLRDLSRNGAESRQTQLSRLENLINQDLQRTLNHIKAKADLFLLAGDDNGASGGSLMVKNYLNLFDDACEKLRSQYRYVIDEMLSSHLIAAKSILNEKLEEDYEGFINKFYHVLDTHTGAKTRLEDDVSNAWERPGTILPKFVDALDKVTAISLNRKEVTGKIQGPILRQIGYVDEEGKEQYSKLTDPIIQTELESLFGGGEVKKQTEEAVKLLPAIALEYTRISGLVSEINGFDLSSPHDLTQPNLVESAQKIQTQFAQFGEISQKLLKGFAAVLAIDIAVDGNADILSLLTGLGLTSSGVAATAGNASIGSVAAGSAVSSTASTTATTTAATTTAGASTGAAIISGVAVAVSVAYLTHLAIQEMRSHDRSVSVTAHAMLNNCRERYQVHFYAHFDEIMRQLRDHLQQTLRRRFGMDQLLTQQDRLIKALADVDNAILDISDALSRSGQTLLPY